MPARLRLSTQSGSFGYEVVRAEACCGGLTSGRSALKYRKIPANLSRVVPLERGTSGFMSSKPPSPPQNAAQRQPCKHLRVQIVSRDAESEFVECKECGEIFESSEFKDMNIEERSSEEF